jgi:sugar lactone lactonase YvrE
MTQTTSPQTTSPLRALLNVEASASACGPAVLRGLRSPLVALLALAIGPISAANAQAHGDTITQSTHTTATGQGAHLASDRSIGHLEPVFEFRGEMPTGVTVSADGRIFVNFPRWGDEVSYTVGELRHGKIVPYPDAAINKFDPAHPGETLGSVQSVVVDPANRLWILDTAALSFSAPVPGGAKLVAVDLSTNKVVKTIVLAPTTALKTTYINDVRFDLRQGKAGIAYITDSSVSGPGAIIVVDLDSGESWRKLSGHPSTSPDPNFVPVVEGKTLAIRETGKPPVPFTVASDGIALSADGVTLYYCPLSSRHLYSIPTALLRGLSTSENDVAKAVVDLGEKGASDGLEADDKGRIYAGDYEHNSIRQRQTDGEWKTIAHDPRILWPDTLSVATDGYLYFTVSQLWRMAQFNYGKDLRQKPYMLFRVEIGAGPVLLK